MKAARSAALFLVTVLLPLCGLRAQDDEPQTIRFRKESNLSKAVFDNTQLMLVVMDRFGNPRENKVISYKLYVKSRRATTEFTGYSNSLTAEMINFLKKEPKAVKLFFTGITAKDDNGHPVSLPDVIETWFPDCLNCDRGGKSRR